MRMKTAVLLSCCTLLGRPLAASAASDCFLTFDGVTGSSTSAGHKGGIDVSRFFWTISLPATSGGAGGAGKTSFGDFRWTQYLDTSTPTLFTDAASGKQMKSAELDLVKAGETPFTYFAIKFDNVLLSGLTLSGASGSSPTVSGSFAYDRLTMRVIPQNPDGSAGRPVTGGWDVKTN